MRPVARELIRLAFAGFLALTIVEACERIAERRSMRRRDDHPSRGRYE